MLCAIAGCGRFGFDDRPSDAPAPVIDTASDAAPACAYQICDGFEAPAVAPVWTPMGAVAIDNTFAHTGASSVHVHTVALAPNGADAAFIRETATLAQSTPIYVRAFLRFGGLPSTNDYGPIMHVYESTNDFEDSLMFSDSALSVYTQWNNANMSTSSPPPLNTWVCVLWSVTRATTATGSVTLGGDVGSLTLTNVPTEGPALTALDIGLIFYSTQTPTAQPALDLWIDDVLVSDTPLTCAD